MDYTEILQSVLTYIDAHIRETLSGEALAKVAGFSPYHFSRVFQWGVGYSVMEYVRRRRLAFAATELGQGRRILDIALDYGFETHSGFSKAFRRHFGCPPEVYRIHAHSDRPACPSLEHTKKYCIGGVVMEPTLITRPAFRLAGYSMKATSIGGGESQAIPAFWGAYCTDGRMEKLHQESFVTDHAEYGACFPADEATGAFDYVIGVEVKEGAEVPAGYHACEVPVATYAVFSTPPAKGDDFPQQIQGTWQVIFAEWFPTSGYEYAPGCVDFELYNEHAMVETGKVAFIYIPVIKKQ